VGPARQGGEKSPLAARLGVGRREGPRVDPACKREEGEKRGWRRLVRAGRGATRLMGP
jgi:hypothetical protein